MDRVKLQSLMNYFDSMQYLDICTGMSQPGLPKAAKKTLRNHLQWKFPGEGNAWLIAALIFLVAMVGGQGFVAL